MRQAATVPPTRITSTIATAAMSVISEELLFLYLNFSDLTL